MKVCMQCLHTFTTDLGTPGVPRSLVVWAPPQRNKDSVTAQIRGTWRYKNDNTSPVTTIDPL